MKLVSWNVNGLRAILQKGFLQYIKKEDPDILCLQEVKCPAALLLGIGMESYTPLWHSAKKAGYAGTLLLTKTKPKSVSFGMGLPGPDDEGRVIVAEFESYFVVNVYTPNSQRGLTRLKYRQQWDAEFLLFVKKLETKKPVILCGDLNVAHKEIDLKNPKSNRKNAGFTDKERDGFTKLMDAGFIDTFREFNKEPGNYTWWSYMFNARARNIGWRIDYFCISASLRPHLKEAFIRSEVTGSDHCPVGIVIT